MQDYPAFVDNGLMGNLHTTALVSRFGFGSRQYLPFTRCDSPGIFAALLDKVREGNWTLGPNGEETTYKQVYLTETAILLTRFFSRKGIAERTDFMPLKEQQKRFFPMRILKFIKRDFDFRKNAGSVLSMPPACLQFKEPAKSPNDYNTNDHYI